MGHLEVIEVVWNGGIEREYIRQRQRSAPEAQRSVSSVVVGPSGAALKGVVTETACQAPGCHHVAKAQHYHADGRKGRLYCWYCGDRALTRATKAVVRACD